MPRHVKNQQFGVRRGPTKAELDKYTKKLEAGNFGFRKYMNRTVRVAKTKALISFVFAFVCAFVFAYAKCWFAHDEAHIWNVQHF